MNGARLDTLDTVIGQVPIMLRSNRCHLAKLSREELVKAGEEATEKGGYFVCKGSEKVREQADWSIVEDMNCL